MKKIVLASLSAKFIHSSLALRYLTKFNDNAKKHNLTTMEFTINQRLDFAALSPGRHTLRIDARDIHHSNMVPVCTRTFTTEGTASHTCNKGEYVYYEAAHPHRDCYACSICGNIWAVDGTSNYYSACQECTADHIPELTCDEVVGVENGVKIRGWAFDPDTLYESVTIHVYIDGVMAGTCTANLSRPDVHNVHGCGEYHGFSTTIPYIVNETESHYVEIFALNTTYGEDPVGRGPFNVTISKHSHSYSSSITTYPTCANTGVRVYYCSDCGGGYTETIPATGNHDYGDWILTDDGGTLVYRKYCSNCSNYVTTHGNSVTYIYGNGEPTQTVAVEPGEYYTIPTNAIPEQFGYDFFGWEANDGTIFQPGDTIPYCGNVTLSALWTKYYVKPDSYKQLSCVMSYPGVGTSFTLLVYESGSYHFEGLNDSGLDTVAYIYDLNGNLICSDDDSAGNRQFLIQQYLEAGSYIVEIDTYYSSAIGTLRWGIGPQMSGTCGDNLRWILDNEGTLTISGTGPMYVYEYKESPWYLNERVKNVVIENGVTNIDNYAFYGCSSLTSVTIPDSVTTIGDGAFDSCVSLTSVTIPDSVTTIGDYAFSFCDSLTSVTIPDSVKTIGGLTFSGCSNLTDVTIGNGVTSIDGSAFYNCSSLTSVTIPDGVTTIDNSAFYGCSNLTSLTIGSSVTYIGGEAFAGCSRLTAVTIPDSVTSIGYSAFSGCSSLTSVTIGNSVTSIRDYAFDSCSSLTSVTIGNGVSTIGNWAFYYCSRLTDVYFGGTAEQWAQISVGDDNEPLENATIHFAKHTHSFTNYISNNDATCTADGTKTAKCDYCEETNTITDAGSKLDHSFTNYISNGDATYDADGTKTAKCDNCDATDTVVDEGSKLLPSGVCGDNLTWTLDEEGTLTISGTGPMSDSFPPPWSKYGSSVKHIHIESGVTTIGKEAFVHCHHVKSVSIPNTVWKISNKAFDYCYALTSVQLPESVTYIGNRAFNICHNLTSINLPQGLTNLGYGAFEDCSKLKSIQIPSTLTLLPALVFQNAGISEITIPATVYQIGTQIFYKCSNLHTVYYNSTYGNDENPFLNVANIKKVVFGGTYIPDYVLKDAINVKEVMILDSVTSIGSSTFEGCSSLTTITIPDSVTSIGYFAFYYCSSLKEIRFGGTKEQWNAIDKGSGWDSWTDNFTVYCTNGEINE